MLAYPAMTSRASFVFSFACVLVASSALAESSPNYSGMTFEKNVAIPMRDGVVLRGDVIRPQGAGPFAVLVYRTPYNKEDALQEYATFQHAVERGYAVVAVDVRGRYASDGDVRPYETEGRDGYDTIEWAAKQSWSNGAVGTFGLSYPGAVQWLAAVENPPHLKAMVPAMTFSTYQNFFYAGGTFDMSWIDWLWGNIAWDVRVKKNLPGPHNYEEAAAEWKKHGDEMHSKLPLNSMDAFRELTPSYYGWLAHPVDDPWWDWCELRNKYFKTSAAVLNLSAWYDDNYGPEGAATNFNGLVHSRGGKPDRTALLMGPWVHGEMAVAKAGERAFPSLAAIDYDEVVLRWLDHYVRGINNGVDRARPVRYYVMGADEWRDADSWPPVARRTPYFLQPGTDGNFGLLVPNTRPAKPGSTAFASDPADPVKNVYETSGAHDYRELSKRSDVLTFETAALDRDTEITGPIEADMFMSCDSKDADLYVRLLDVAPDGTAFNLMSPGLDVQRASYRQIAKGRQLLTPDTVYELHLTNLMTSNVFKSGHRIRIQISGSFFPNFSRNLQTGELETVSGKTQKATIRIYHERAHPSRMILPVIAHN